MNLQVKKSPVLAGILSVVSPGLGQFYVGKVVAGLVFFLGTLVLAGLIPLGIGLCFFWIWWIIGIVHAVSAASR